MESKRQYQLQRGGGIPLSLKSGLGCGLGGSHREMQPPHWYENLPAWYAADLALREAVG